MTIVFDESNLRFTFDENHWKVIKYDDHPSHAAIKISEHKAIDFLGVYNNKTLVFFELKNYRLHRLDPSTQQVMAKGAEELSTIIAQKVRDSVSGIVGSGRNPDSIDHNLWSQISAKMINEKNEFYIISWVEEDAVQGYYKSQKQQAKAISFLDKLKNKLKWLNAKISIRHIKNLPPFEGFKVERLSENEINTLSVL